MENKSLSSDFLSINFYLIAIAIILLSLLSKNTIKKLLLKTSTKLPPGPRGLPLVGNYLQMGKRFHLKFCEWGSQYGKLCTIHLATQPALLISDPKYMKDIFGMFAATGTYKTDQILLVSQGPYGIGSTEGKAWTEQRQFCMKSLKKFGFGRSMEPLILQEVLDVCDWIKKTQNNNFEKPVVLNDVFIEAAINTLWNLVNSEEKMKIGDSKVTDLLNEWSEQIENTTKSGLAFFPWLKYVAPQLSGYNALNQICKDIHKLVKEKFKSHEKSYVNGMQRDIIDMFIEEMKEAENLPLSGFHGELGVKNTMASLVEIYIAGGKTSSVTLLWGLFHLARNQEILEKLEIEVDKVVGKERNPSLFDKRSMPFLEAVILETLRISSLLPIGIMHQLMEDISYQGYNFPKGMLLIPNMYFIHHNPEIWGDPETFRPERFLLDENLKDYIVAFQAGKRACLGEPLAKDVLFLFLAKLIQQFKITLDPNVDPEEYIKYEMGMLLAPQHLGLVLKPRI